MRFKTVVLIALAVALLGIALSLSWPNGYMTSREIGCDKVDQLRAREICKSVSDSMEWTWMGHAIISPGWRLTSDGLRRVYCTEKIKESDLPTLESLKRASDWRLQTAAEDLIRIVTNIGGTGTEPDNSIFSPKNTDYILKDGCREFD